MYSRILRATVFCAVAALLVLAPIFIEEFWLRLGFIACGAAVGALGLNVLTGAAGQLSLAHAFFLAVGALTYCGLAGDADPSFGPGGLGWPPLLAVVASVAVTAAVGLAVSPLSSRLSGLYLGVASLALVYIGQHLFVTVEDFTGGHNGRSTPPLSAFGLEFSNKGDLVVAGVSFGTFERLWYVGLLTLALAAWTIERLLHSRHGRAMRMIRDKPIAAAVSGIHIRRTKQNAFVVSSALAGLSGCMYALAIGSVAPVSFTLDVSVQYLVMIVIGGMGTVSGSIVGATFVSAVPLLLQRYADQLPFIGENVTPASAARYLYGAAVIAVLILQPKGLAVLLGRLVPSSLRTPLMIAPMKARRTKQPRRVRTAVHRER